MIDFVVISSDLRPYVLDTLVRRLNCSHLVWSWIRPGRANRIVKFCWECLAENTVRMVFNCPFWQNFNHIPEVVWILSGSCSGLPLSRWLLEAVVARSLLLVVTITPEAAPGHQR